MVLLLYAFCSWGALTSRSRRFPKYKPKNNKISIWSESYGGHYGPSFAAFFTEQNRKIADGTISNNAVTLHLDTVGIVNGCVDLLTQMPGYSQMAYNNTYGIQIINETEFNAVISNFPACRTRVYACQSLADSKDPNGLGNNEEVNRACVDAYNYCMTTTKPDFESRGVSRPSVKRLLVFPSLTVSSRETSTTSQPWFLGRSLPSMPAAFSTQRESNRSWVFRSISQAYRWQRISVRSQGS